MEKRSLGASRRPSPREVWERAEADAKRRKLEDLFEHQTHAHGLPKAEREYRFDQVRRWRFDFAWPEFMVAVEIDGGTMARGRHVRPKGFEADAEKTNAASAAGWKVFRYTSSHVRSGYAVAQTRVELERAARAKYGLPV